MVANSVWARCVAGSIGLVAGGTGHAADTRRRLDIATSNANVMYVTFQEMQGYHVGDCNLWADQTSRSIDGPRPSVGQGANQPSNRRKLEPKAAISCKQFSLEPRALHLLSTHNLCQLTRGRADVAQFTSEAMESVPSSCGRRLRDRGPLCRTGNGGDWNRRYRTQQPALNARAVRSIAMRSSRARCVYRKLNPNVLMMKSTQDSERT
jgi:hypothetical protein